jgi:nicotinamidase-related amidase
MGAMRLGWSWREGPLLGILDLLTLPGPATREAFTDTLEGIISDPAGPFGETLLAVTRRARTAVPARADAVSARQPGAARPGSRTQRERLRDAVGEEAAALYEAAPGATETCAVPAEETALLVIDPQRSFTEGAWMRSIGNDAEADVEPLRLAFETCAERLERVGGKVEVMLTRCPFPADSYDWAAPIGQVLGERRPYFVKPGNSVLRPQTNGFAETLNALLQRPIRYLVVGGCTLTSCVRVSAVALQKRFGPQGLQVVVELTSCGARARNYAPSTLFHGLSPVAAALREMQESGVIVARKVAWELGPAPGRPIHPG